MNRDADVNRTNLRREAGILQSCQILSERAITHRHIEAIANAMFLQDVSAANLLLELALRRYAAHYKLLRPARSHVEEYRLGDNTFHHVRCEWLGDQESRLRTLASQQTFGERCDEDDRDANGLEQVVDGINA